MSTSNERGISTPVAIAALVLLLMVVFMFRGMSNASTLKAPEARAATTDSIFAAVAEEPTSARRATAPATAEPAKPTIDFQLHSRLTSAINQGQALVNNGRRQAMRIAEADADAGLRTPQARAATQQWNSFVRSFGEEISRYGQTLSHAGSGVGFDNPAYMVYQELTFMLNELNAVGVNPASTTNIPMRYMRESRFDQAQHRLDEAQRMLRELR
jgi:Na+-transporting methylmalonyl-CoA/oxaloacetate decarboxylase gamma subunit